LTITRGSRENPEVREFLLRNVAEHPSDVAALAGAQFGLSRNAINGYINRLIESGLLTGQGQTKARTYALKNISMHSATPEIVQGLAENDVWREKVMPYLKKVPANVVDICQYGFTEMFNNVVDHSESKKSLIKYRQNYTTVEMTVADYGVGIFEKIQKDFNLTDPRSALLELSKGKLTSDKTNHSGEGIFFTSRMFDKFSLHSGRLFYSKTKTNDGWLTETRDLVEYTRGTVVRMTIGTDATRSLREAFEKHTTQELDFSKTHVPVSLGRYPGEQLVSRSQAKRILARFDRFAEVYLDFTGVPEIGQAFGDEIFRVFANAHPQIKLVATNASPEVERIIAHVRNRGALF
jgi:anti-sigma regulatory factor (Ser/Thr protein kinase)